MLAGGYGVVWYGLILHAYFWHFRCLSLYAVLSLSELAICNSNYNGSAGVGRGGGVSYNVYLWVGEKTSRIY
jgi:hypothetical protein